jgi:muconolactone D-isomerase
MEFLVNIKLKWSEGMSEEAIDRVSREERARAADYAEKGNLVRMWRVPGRFENWGLWRAATTTELHDIISGLPAWPWMDVTVHPLSDHPVDPPIARSAATR